MDKAAGTSVNKFSPTKKNKFKFPKLNPLIRRFIAAYLSIFTLLVGTLVGLKLMGEGQDIRQSASTNNVDLSLNAPDSVARNQQFTVSVIVNNTNGRQVTAADIRLNYPANIIRLDSITKGNYFATNNMAAPAPTNTYGWDNVGMVLLQDAATTGVGRYALGALCDYCRLGTTCQNPANYPNACTILPLCTATSAGSNPTCYPKTNGPSNPGTLATYTFTALTAGTANLTLTGTEVAALNADTNVAGDLVGDSVVVVSSVPSPSPTSGTTPTACNADFSNDGNVNMADYGIFRQNFAQNPPTVAATDLNGDGNVNMADYGLFRQYFGTSGCN